MATTPRYGLTSPFASVVRRSGSTSTPTSAQHIPVTLRRNNSPEPTESCRQTHTSPHQGDSRMSSFEHRVAVITGAGSGIGRELAVGLAQRGARLAISDVNEDGLAKTAERIKPTGAEIHSEILDVSDREAVKRYANSVGAHYGTVHQIYNNAGVAAGATPVIDCDYEAYERIIAINLWG